MVRNVREFGKKMMKKFKKGFEIFLLHNHRGTLSRERSHLCSHATDIFFRHDKGNARILQKDQIEFK